MRSNLLFLAAGIIGLSLAGLLTLPGQAGDSHRSRSDEKELKTARPKTVNPPPAQDSYYPPIEPFRNLYFFPDAAPNVPPVDKLKDVTLQDNYFSPSLLYVTRGTTVRWTNRGSHHHTITSKWIWESGELNTGDAFVLKFSRLGTYSYR